MTLQQLRYIITVAETGNITEAAEKLFISQPSLTTAIHSIEKEMSVTIFARSNKGVVVTREGEEFLSYARQVIDQADLMQEKYGAGKARNPRFSVSCQHYSFAVNAFADVVKEYDSDSYDFTLRETQTYEIIEDVSLGKSEIGVIYLSDKNREVLTKLFKKHELTFEELFVANPHVFISKDHPLAGNKIITLDELRPYPYLTFEQGEHNSFYYSEEILGSYEVSKNIKVRDRATLFSLVIGLDGYTVSSGVIDTATNGLNIIARPLKLDDRMQIGIIYSKNRSLSRYANTYIEAIRKYSGGN